MKARRVLLPENKLRYFRVKYAHPVFEENEIMFVGRVGRETFSVGEDAVILHFLREPHYLDNPPPHNFFNINQLVESSKEEYEGSR